MSARLNDTLDLILDEDFVPGIEIEGKPYSYNPKRRVEDVIKGIEKMDFGFASVNYVISAIKNPEKTCCTSLKIFREQHFLRFK